METCYHQQSPLLTSNKKFTKYLVALQLIKEAIKNNTSLHLVLDESIELFIKHRTPELFQIINYLLKNGAKPSNDPQTYQVISKILAFSKVFGIYFPLVENISCQRLLENLFEIARKEGSISEICLIIKTHPQSLVDDFISYQEWKAKILIEIEDCIYIWENEDNKREFVELLEFLDVHFR